MDYRYNSRDWLRMINHQNYDAIYEGYPQDPGKDGTNGIPVDKFSLALGYDVQDHIGVTQNAARQYNGNISWLMSRTKDINFSGYNLLCQTFSYDFNNRLLTSNFGYYSTAWQNTNSFDVSASYEQNGNICNIIRYKNGNLRLVKDGNHQGGNNNVNKSGDVSTNQTNSGSFSMNNPGKIILYINQVLEEIATGIITFQIKGPSDYTYDLQGNVIEKSYYDFNPGTLTTYVKNTYDNTGRLTTVKTKYIPTSGFIQDAEYRYFASGKVKRLKLGSAQGVDYRYNQRDWLTMINHQNLDQFYQGIPQDPGADGTGAGQSGLPADKFGMIIGYNTQNHIALPQYQNAATQWNGNISWIIYRMKNVMYSGTDLVGYTFGYDKANRLRNSDFGYYGASWMTASAYDELITDAPKDPEQPSGPINPGYDENGNIASLLRYNSSGLVSDQFIYNYEWHKNRLSFTSGTSAIQYKYDGNGNVIKDSGKNIALIIYDTDNLPVTVYKTDGSQIQYYYDVNGNRVKKTIVGGSSTYYINGYDGKTEVVSHVPTGSDFTYNIWGNDLIGQVRVVGTIATRYYYLKDHLGNIRMTVNSAGNAVSWDDYYPFGSVMNGRSQISSADNRYKFTGKERDTETNYDYFGARYYDARIGRWLQVDPLGSKYPEWSPYNYTLNNPIKLVDPNGKAPDDPANVNPAQIILTQFFDVKHSVENLILVFKPAPEGMKWQADYATDEAGNEIFKTEIKLVDSEGLLNDAIGYAGDVLNVAGGKINDGASLMAKGAGKNQVIEIAKGQLQMLSKGEIKALEKAGIDIHDLKGGKSGRIDLYKDKKGNIKIMPKGGKGEGEDTGLNMKDILTEE